MVHESLQELSQAQKSLLAMPYGGQRLSSLASDPSMATELYNQKPVIPEDRLKLFSQVSHSSSASTSTLANGKSSYVMLDQSSSAAAASNPTGESSVGGGLSSRLDSLEKIFNVISSRNEIDYPVCQDCAQSIMQQLKQQVANLEKENETYAQFLKRLMAQKDPQREQVESTLEELKQLQERESQVLQLLQEEEKLNAELISQIDHMEQKLSVLRTKEEQCCLQKNNYEMQLQTHMDKLDQSKAKYASNLDILESLRKTNVFDSLFDISYDGPFGTICGLRLGSLPDSNVSWHEINAALGQIILLLSTCLQILQLDLPQYKLIPMGSTSRIEYKRHDKQTGVPMITELKLFSNGEFSIVGFLKHNNLDRGMACLLDVIRLISDHLIAKGHTALPYPIVGDTISGISIRPSNRAKWENWTHACKLVLVDVNWIKSYCVDLYLNSNSGSGDATGADL